MFRLTWKRRITPSGRRICALRASARRTFDSDFSSWPTAAARDWKGESASDEFNAERWAHHRGKPLSAVATLAPWPTPQAHDQRGANSEERIARQREKGYGTRNLNEMSRLTAAPWATPLGNSREMQPRRMHKARADGGQPNLALMASWATPTGNDSKGSGYMYDRGDHTKIRLKLPGEARLALGPTSSGSPAETEKPGQLNPAFSLWLMGYPTEWALCAARVTRSARKRLPSSSPPSARSAE